MTWLLFLRLSTLYCKYFIILNCRFIVSSYSSSFFPPFIDFFHFLLLFHSFRFSRLFSCFLSGCEELASHFLSQEIDGQALLLLREEHLMSTMNIKLGPALKICAHINTLRDWSWIGLKLPHPDTPSKTALLFFFTQLYISSKPPPNGDLTSSRKTIRLL